MSSRLKIKRNDPCPCLSGEKYKKCCYEKVAWEPIIEEARDYRPYLSIRGRNLLFVKGILNALQLGPSMKARTLKDYKAAFTADAVRKIHEALMCFWPPDIDIAAALTPSSTDVSGLYIGDYTFEYLRRAVLRHSIYANRILLIDPFVYPASVRDEYNPILNPDQYRTQTLKNVNLWLEFLPWIEAGLVAFIRPPSDFDPKLNWEILTSQSKKFAQNPELEKEAEESARELSARHKQKFMQQQMLLGAPDVYLRQKFEELGLGKGRVEFDKFLSFIQNKRDQDPDFLEPLGPRSKAQLHIMSSGASYPSAKITAGITGSYLFTDIHVRWKEIELDRESRSAENRVWAPFAKALQNAPLKYLNNIRLEHALTLRKEGRLGSLRAFLGKVWKDASTDDQYDSENAIHLGEELGERIREAELEWKKIDAELLKLVVPAATGGLLAAGPLIASGHGLFLAAASVVAGGGSLINSTMQRRSFPDRFPAAFFMKIEEADS